MAIKNVFKRTKFSKNRHIYNDIHSLQNKKCTKGTSTKHTNRVGSPKSEKLLLMLEPVRSSKFSEFTSQHFDSKNELKQ